MANSTAVLEYKMTQTQRDVASNEVRIDESERRVLVLRYHSKKRKLHLMGPSSVSLSLNPEQRIWKTEGDGKTSGCLGAKGQQSLFHFINGRLLRWLGLAPIMSFALERVHHTLVPRTPNQRRTILIRFLKFQEKGLIYWESQRREITYDGARNTFGQDPSAETVQICWGFNSNQVIC